MGRSCLVNHPVYTNYVCILYYMYNIGVGILYCLNSGGGFFFFSIQFIEYLIIILVKYVYINNIGNM